MHCLLRLWECKTNNYYTYQNTHIQINNQWSMVNLCTNLSDHTSPKQKISGTWMTSSSRICWQCSHGQTKEDLQGVSSVDGKVGSWNGSTSQKKMVPLLYQYDHHGKVSSCFFGAQMFYGNKSHLYFTQMRRRWIQQIHLVTKWDKQHGFQIWNRSAITCSSMTFLKHNGSAT